MHLHHVLIQQSTWTYTEHLEFDQSQPVFTWHRALGALKMVQTSYASVLLAENEPFINISWGLLLHKMDWQLLKYKAGLWTVNVKQLTLRECDRMFSKRGNFNMSGSEVCYFVWHQKFFKKWFYNGEIHIPQLGGQN